MTVTAQERGEKKCPKGFGKHCQSSLCERLQSHEWKQTTDLQISPCADKGFKTPKGLYNNILLSCNQNTYCAIYALPFKIRI